MNRYSSFLKKIVYAAGLRDQLSLAFRFAFVLLVGIVGFPIFASTAFAYNRSAAVAYADKWALSNDPNYLHYSEDCTGFASEAMYAGGDQQNRAWHGDKTSLSADWDVAPDNYFYEVNQNGAHLAETVNSSNSDYWNSYNATLPGDLIYYDWTGDGSIDHMAFQVNAGKAASDPNNPGWSFTGDLMDQHTTNRWHAPWNDIEYNPNYSITVIYEVSHKN
jgi:hypothetical protein